jgi:regulator of sigma E protease
MAAAIFPLCFGAAMPIMHVLKIVFIVLEVVVLFNLLIFVHELGHFLAARWRGLKIERFAIWFGKPIWKTKIGDVEYCLGSIPAGGYVSLPQMAPMEMIEGKGDEKKEPLPTISVLDKIIVAFAGPLFSFLLALVFAVIVMYVGRPESESEKTSVIGLVEKGGPADLAGLKPGDRILEIDGGPVSKFSGMGDSVMWRVVRSEGDTIPIVIARSNELTGTIETKTMQVTPVKEPTKAWQRKSLRQIKVEPAQSAIIAEVLPDSPASRAGLKPHDEVKSIDGRSFWHFAQVAEYLKERKGQPVALRIGRGNETLDKTVTPLVPLNTTNKDPLIGIKWTFGGKMKLAHPDAIEQVHGSVNAMISTFGALFSRKGDIKPQHLGGAVKILSVYYMLFESPDGWRLALWFSVLMNVNLAILNLLPFPVLDGGHITLALIEAARRKPVNARILNWIQSGCAAVLILYMVYIMFYDVQDLLPTRDKKPKEEQIQFPKEPPK